MAKKRKWVTIVVGLLGVIQVQAKNTTPGAIHLNTSISDKLHACISNEIYKNYDEAKKDCRTKYPVHAKGSASCKDMEEIHNCMKSSLSQNYDQAVIKCRKELGLTQMNTHCSSTPN